MKLSALKQLVQTYDNRKGWRRKLFGDALPIQVLKELISSKEASSNSDAEEISLQAYNDFANAKGYSVDLSEGYLNSDRASADVFRQWKRNDAALLTTLNSLQATLTVPTLDLSSFTAIQNNLNTINFNLPELTIAMPQIESLAPVLPTVVENLLEQQRLVFSHSSLTFLNAAPINSAAHGPALQAEEAQENKHGHGSAAEGKYSEPVNDHKLLSPNTRK